VVCRLVSKLALLTLSLLALCGFSSKAAANGRFPRAERLIEHRDDPNRLVLSATYGLLVTSDRGRNWYYICEKAFSMQDNYVGDPLFAWTADDTMLTGVQASLDLSHDQGCSWSMAFGGFAGQIATDYALGGKDGSVAVLLVSSLDDGGLTHRLSESTDNARTWHAIGDPLPVALAYTLDVDSNDATHIFATGVDGNNQGVFLVSTTHGSAWSSYSIPNTTADEPPYIALVNPNDANKIYLRTDAWPEIDGNQVGNDAFLYSSDGGKTWQEEFRVQGKLLGFALSPTDDTVLLGYGDPKREPFVVDPAVLGIYSSPTSSFQFAKIYDGSVTCLTWNATGLYACTSQVEQGYAMGFAASASAVAANGAAAFTPLLHMSDVKAPLGCCTGSTTLTCGALWPTSCAIFGTCPDAGVASVSAPACASDANGGSGAPEPSPDAGVASPDAPASADVASADAARPRAGSTACACRVSGAQDRGRLTPFAVYLLCLIRFRKDRRRVC